MKNKILFMVSLLVLVMFAAACSKTGTTGAPKEVGITIGPEDQAANETPAAAPSATESPAKTETNATPETKPSATETAAPESGLPEITCDESETIGYIKCTKMQSGDAELMIKNSGREDIAGVYIKYYLQSKVAGSSSSMSGLSVGNDSTVPLEVKKYAADKIEVFPIWDGNICINKQIVINPAVNCR